MYISSQSMMARPYVLLSREEGLYNVKDTKTIENYYSPFHDFFALWVKKGLDFPPTFFQSWREEEILEI